MLKVILDPIQKVINSRLSKYGIKEELSKHSDYVEKAKEIWDMVDRDFGISSTIDNILKLKIDKFDQMLNTKFPELAKDDAIEFKKAIIDNLIKGKELILDKENILNELQNVNSKLKDENEKLKDQLSKLQSVTTSNDIITNRNDITVENNEK